jgi:hypothetical protein
MEENTRLCLKEMYYNSKSTPCALKTFIHKMLWDFPNSSSDRKTYLHFHYQTLFQGGDFSLNLLNL